MTRLFLSPSWPEWRLRAWDPLALAVATLFLLWPAIINGQPFIMADTTAYIRGADAAVFRLTGIETEWTDEFQKRYTPGAPRQQAERSETTDYSPVTLAGRSIYYGVLLYVSHLGGSLWIAALAQAFVVALALRLTLRNAASCLHVEIATSTYLVVMTAVLTVLSPVSYFASYLLPDLFSGLTILAVANVLLISGARGQQQILFWFALLAAGCLFHTSNILICAALLLFTLSLKAVSRMEVSSRGLASLLLAPIIGLVGELAFTVAVTRATGEPPIRPPFVTARLIADGPGRTYLEKSCPTVDFAVCRYVDALPRFSDDFLWAPQRPQGVFSAVSSEQRRALSGDELAFAAAVVAADPASVFASSARAIIAQAGKWSLIEFNYDETQRLGFEAKLPPSTLQEQSKSAAFRGQMPVKLVEVATPTGFMTAIAFFLWFLLSRRAPGATSVMIIIVIAGVMINVAICGALSTPHDRYLMRAVWPVHLVAIMLSILLFVSSARRSPRVFLQQ